MSDDNKVDRIYETIIDHHEETSSRLALIEYDLREHKEGVIQNRARIERLEEPAKALTKIKEWAIWLAAVSGGIAAFAKLMEWI